MNREKIEHALRVISAPAGSYDPSTIECARQILRAAMLLGIGRVQS